jgi:CubicO group peptidase (beta-lactamase class C family)
LKSSGGTSYDKALEEKILKPLGMDHSGTDQATSLIKDKATGYSYSVEGYVQAPYINPYLSTYSAGAMYATASDLQKWQNGLFGGKVMSQESLKLMLSPGLGNYGYGVYIVKTPVQNGGETIIGHNGSISGFSSSMLRYQGRDTLTVIVLDNTRAEKRASLENLVAAIHDILLNKTPKAPPRSAMVELAKEADRSTAPQLIARYQQLKTDKAAYSQSGIVNFLFELSAHYLEDHRSADALTIAQLLTQEQPALAASWNYYGAALAQLGKKTEAIAAYTHALSLDGSDSDSRLALTRLK